MAVTIIKNPSTLKLRYDLGRDEETGRVKVKSKSYSNVAADASADDVHIVGTVLASLQNHMLLEVAKIDNNTLAL